MTGLARVARPWLAFPLTLATALVFSPRARASDVRYAELHYERDSAASSCADADELRTKVATRLGYAPFREKASLVITAHVRKRGKGFDAQLTSKDADAHASGARQLSSPGDDCGELIESVALAISVVIDPLALTRPSGVVEGTPAPPVPAPEASAVSSPTAPLTSPPTSSETPPALDVNAAPPSEPAARIELEPTLGVIGAVASAPAPSFGFTIGAGLRRRNVSLALEGRADLGADGAADGAGRTVSSSLLLASLVPCFRPGPFFGCAVIGAGALHGTGRAAGTGPLSQTTFYAAAGPRVGVGLELTRVLAIEGYADLLAVLTRTELTLNDTTVWTTPAVALGVGLRLAGRIR